MPVCSQPENACEPRDFMEPVWSCTKLSSFDAPFAAEQFADLIVSSRLLREPKLSVRPATVFAMLRPEGSAVLSRSKAGIEKIFTGNWPTDLTAAQPSEDGWFGGCGVGRGCTRGNVRNVPRLAPLGG